jgi:hypothetical protein
MSQEPEELTPEELETEEGEELPERQAMSLVDLGPDFPPLSSEEIGRDSVDE